MLQRQHDDEVERPEIRFDDASDEADDTLVLHESVSGEAESVTPEAEQIIGSKAYIRRCCEFVRDAALALDHAHQQGVIHRDIKPENLMLDRKGTVRIIDFGVARFRDDVSLSQTGALVGTPMYMSPETITGRVNIDHRSDIFSLGVVLYEALTLRPPYSASTREGIFQKIVSQAMPPVSWRNRAISRELEAVVHKAIARDPDDRYQTAAGFAGDLQDHLDGKQVIAAPYRYKTDEREIAASRPIHAIFVSIGFLLLFVMSSGSYMTIVLDINGQLIDRRQISYEFITLWGCANLILFWFFWGWLRGLRTPIYLASLFSGLLFIWHSYDTYIKDNGSHVDKDVGDFVTFFIMNCFFLLATALPFLPKTRGWLRNAKRFAPSTGDCAADGLLHSAQILRDDPRLRMSSERFWTYLQ